MCVCVCVSCRLSLVGAWLVLGSGHHILVLWCKMWVLRRAIRMRNPVLALLFLSIIIMLVCGGLGSKVVLVEQVVIKVLPGPKAIWGIMPDAVQRQIALYQMPPRSKGPGTSTVPCQSAKLRVMRLQDLCILHPPDILAGFVRSCLCAHVMHANTCYHHATHHLVYPR